jgi:hypothetical protein
VEHLHDIYTKKGDTYLDNLLNDTVVINVKIDQCAFVIKKNDGIFSYHGREGRGEINNIKRSTMDIYEDCIHHIEPLLSNKIPDNSEIYLELFNEKLKTKVQYSTKPKNNLILSYINQSGSTLLPTNPENKRIASLLDISEPPVLFSGKLSENQKKQIKSFVITSAEERKHKYGGKEFIEYIMSIFKTPEHLSWLHEGGYEGLVFYFENNKCSAKLVDPLFTSDKQEERYNEMSDFKKLLTDIIFQHLEEDVELYIKHTTFSLDETTDDTFIYFISRLTLLMCMIHSEELKNLNQFMLVQKEQRFSNITYSLLPLFMGPLINNYHWWAEELYITLANLLQKEKKRINIKQGLTQERKETINRIVSVLCEQGIVK